MGGTNYLLGKDKNGKKVWLERSEWSCGWYWGIGYVEIYNNRNNLDIHTHFDTLFFEKGFFNSFKNYFSDTPLSDNEIWKLLELMKTAYSLRSYADILYRGGSNITGVEGVNEIIKNDDERKRINEKVIPYILEKVYALLTPDNKQLKYIRR